MRETVTQHLYGVSKKDNINYSYISSVDVSAERKMTEKIEVNQLSTEQRRVILPAFRDMIDYVHEMAQKRLSNTSIQRFVYGRTTIPYSYEVYTEVSFRMYPSRSFDFKP